jgi:PilZ domain-containing protein
MERTMEQRGTLQCEVELTGVLARQIPTRLVEISRSGCLLESSHRIEEGTVAALSLEVRGQRFSGDVRATRCVAVAGLGSRYLVGVEFLDTGRTDGASIRHAMLSALLDSTPGMPSSWST